MLHINKFLKEFNLYLNQSRYAIVFINKRICEMNVMASARLSLKSVNLRNIKINWQAETMKNCKRQNLCL